MDDQNRSRYPLFDPRIPPPTMYQTTSLPPNPHGASENAMRSALPMPMGAPRTYYFLEDHQRSSMLIGLNEWPHLGLAAHEVPFGPYRGTASSTDSVNPAAWQAQRAPNVTSQAPPQSLTFEAYKNNAHSSSHNTLQALEVEEKRRGALLLNQGILQYPGFHGNDGAGRSSHELEGKSTTEALNASMQKALIWPSSSHNAHFGQRTLQGEENRRGALLQDQGVLQYPGFHGNDVAGPSSLQLEGKWTTQALNAPIEKALTLPSSSHNALFGQRAMEVEENRRGALLQDQGILQYPGFHGNDGAGRSSHEREGKWTAPVQKALTLPSSSHNALFGQQAMEVEENRRGALFQDQGVLQYPGFHGNDVAGRSSHELEGKWTTQALNAPMQKALTLLSSSHNAQFGQRAMEVEENRRGALLQDQGVLQYTGFHVKDVAGRSSHECEAKSTTQALTASTIENVLPFPTLSCNALSGQKALEWEGNRRGPVLENDELQYPGLYGNENSDSGVGNRPISSPVPDLDVHTGMNLRLRPVKKPASKSSTYCVKNNKDYEECANLLREPVKNKPLNQSKKGAQRGKNKPSTSRAKRPQKVQIDSDSDQGVAPLPSKRGLSLSRSKNTKNAKKTKTVYEETTDSEVDDPDPAPASNKNGLAMYHAFKKKTEGKKDTSDSGEEDVEDTIPLSKASASFSTIKQSPIIISSDSDEPQNAMISHDVGNNENNQEESDNEHAIMSNDDNEDGPNNEHAIIIDSDEEELNVNDEQANLNLNDDEEEPNDDPYICSVGHEPFHVDDEVLQCWPCRCRNACVEHGTAWVAVKNTCYQCCTRIEEAYAIKFYV